MWADLHPRSGSEQQGRRPVIVVCHDGFNRTPAWRSVIILPVSTSRSQAARGPTAIHLAAGIGGLAAERIARGHQVTTLDRSKLVEPIGHLPSADLARLAEGLKAALDLTKTIKGPDDSRGAQAII